MIYCHSRQGIYVYKSWKISGITLQPFKAFRNFNQENLKGACGNCEYKISCGGCRALAFLFKGDFYAEDPMCIRAQKGVMV